MATVWSDLFAMWRKRWGWNSGGKQELCTAGFTSKWTKRQSLKNKHVTEQVRMVRILTSQLERTGVLEQRSKSSVVGQQGTLIACTMHKVSGDAR